MGVNVIDVRWRYTCLFQRDAHCLGGTFTAFQRLGNMKRIGRGTVSGDFCQNGNIPFQGVVQLLHDKYTGALADDKSVTLGVKGA